MPPPQAQSIPTAHSPNSVTSAEMLTTDVDSIAAKMEFASWQLVTKCLADKCWLEASDGSPEAASLHELSDGEEHYVTPVAKIKTG